MKSKAEPEPEPEAEPDTEAERDTEAEADTEAEPVPETEPDATALPTAVNSVSGPSSREEVRVSVLPDDAAARTAYWPLPIARAVPAAVIAIVITFSADHSARLGLLAFGGFAAATGIILVLFGSRRLRSRDARPYLVAQGAVSVVLGVVALALNGGGLATLFLVVTVWAAITGALELYIGLRTRRRHVASVDWITVGSLTLLAAVVFVLLPPDLADEFTNADGSTGVLDSAVVAVGLLGAYAAIIVVYLVVAGLSAKWGTRAEPAAQVDRTEQADRTEQPDGKDAA